MQNKATNPAKADAKAKAAPKAKAAKPAKTAAETAKLQAQAEAARTSRGLTRDAATVEKQATNFEQYSDRDTAYLRFFGSIMRKNNGTATLAQIHDAGKANGGTKRSNPFYTGSAKATDAGAINRLIKAGYITKSDNGGKLTITATGKTQAAYNGKTA